MLTLANLRDMPDETANRMMVAHGSRMLLRALKGEPEPVEPRERPRVRLVKRVPKPRHVRVKDRPPIKTPPVVQQIIDQVAEAFTVTPAEVMGPCRAKHLVAARAVACRLIRDRVNADGEPKHSLPRIAQFMGRRDHSTICNSIKQFPIYCQLDPDVAEVYARLREPVA